MQTGDVRVHRSVTKSALLCRLGNPNRWRWPSGPEDFWGTYDQEVKKFVEEWGSREGIPNN